MKMMASSSASDVDYYHPELQLATYQLGSLALHQPAPVYYFQQPSMPHSQTPAVTSAPFVPSIAMNMPSYSTDWNGPNNCNFAGYIPNLPMVADQQNSNLFSMNYVALGGSSGSTSAAAHNMFAASLNSSHAQVQTNMHLPTMNRNTSAPSLSAGNTQEMSTNGGTNSNSTAQLSAVSRMRQPNVNGDSNAHSRLQRQNHSNAYTALPPRLAKQPDRGRQVLSCSGQVVEKSDTTTDVFVKEDVAPKYSILKRESGAKDRSQHAIQPNEPVSYETRLREYEAARRRILGCPISGCNCNGTCGASSNVGGRGRNGQTVEKRPDCVIISRRSSDIPAHQKADMIQSTINCSDTSLSPSPSLSTNDSMPNVNQASNQNDLQVSRGSEEKANEIVRDELGFAECSDLKLNHATIASDPEVTLETKSKDNSQAESFLTGVSTDSEDAASKQTPAQCADSNTPKIVILKRDQR